MKFEKRYLKTSEVATYLNFSESAIRKWQRLGLIPFKKMNGGIRFDIQEIEKWADMQRIPRPRT